MDNIANLMHGFSVALTTHHVLLMMAGVYGILFEFWSPGAVAPGVIGAICLTLGLYALNQLPLDYAGLALIAIGISFMVAEAFAPSFGLLGVGGIVAFVLGAACLSWTAHYSIGGRVDDSVQLIAMNRPDVEFVNA